MRVCVTDLKLQGDGWTVEIWEYHDKHGDFVGPTSWHARIVVQEDGGADIINFNRNTQQELYTALEGGKDAFESAQTAVLDVVGANV